jgi:hypothetical protein
MKDLYKRQSYFQKYIEYLETLLGMDKIENIIEKIGNFKYEDEQHMGWEDWLSRETKSILRVSRIEKVNIKAKSELLKIDLFQNYIYLEHLLFYHTTIKAFPILCLGKLELQIIETLNLNQKVLHLNNSILFILLKAGKVRLISPNYSCCISSTLTSFTRTVSNYWREQKAKAKFL